MAVWSSFAFKNIAKNVEITRGIISSFKNVPKIKVERRFIILKRWSQWTSYVYFWYYQLVILTANYFSAVNYVPVRSSHDRTIVIRNSTFGVFQFKDLVYFYLTIGIIPLVALSLYCNIFIGPAKLALIPEGYDPKPWEYYPHPITRFMAKYLVRSKQECYERTLHNVFCESEMIMLRKLESKVKDLIKERGDYQSWYFDKAEVKYTRRMHELSKEHLEKSGSHYGLVAD